MNQSEISIQPDGECETGTCPCCGRISRRVWGYAYQDSACLAAYFVHWTIGHIVDNGANFDMILGQWGEGAIAKNRCAISVEYRLTGSGPAFMVIDANARPIVAKSDLVGRVLDRNQVVGNPIAKTVFGIADAVLANDPRIVELLGGWQLKS